MLENSERSRGVRMGKSGPLERAELANQIQGFRIPDRWDASEKNKSWYCLSLIFSINYRKTPLSVNDPVNENSPNWFLYRLTADRMKSLKAVSTHWRATCSFDKHGINNYEDYIRGQFAEADILAFLGAGVCLKTELVNIRGHIGIHKTARFWQVLSTYFLNIDSSSKGCQFEPNVGAVSSEDNFGLYDVVNPKFACTVNEDSTTQWWFGGYQ